MNPPRPSPQHPSARATVSGPDFCCHEKVRAPVGTPRRRRTPETCPTVGQVSEGRGRSLGSSRWRKPVRQSDKFRRTVAADRLLRAAEACPTVGQVPGEPWSGPSSSRAAETCRTVGQVQSDRFLANRGRGPRLHPGGGNLSDSRTGLEDRGRGPPPSRAAETCRTIGQVLEERGRGAFASVGPQEPVGQSDRFGGPWWGRPTASGRREPVRQSDRFSRTVAGGLRSRLEMEPVGQVWRRAVSDR